MAARQCRAIVSPPAAHWPVLDPACGTDRQTDWTMRPYCRRAARILRRDDVFRRDRARLFVLDIPPDRASRSFAAAAARAFRVAVGQAHLECEIGAQEIRKVGAIGTDEQIDLVFLQAEMIVQQIARRDRAARHAAPATTARRRAARRTASRSRPSRDFPCRGPMNCVSARRCPAPNAPRRLGRGDHDLAHDGAAFGRSIVARQASPASCRRPAMPLPRARNRAGRRGGRAIWRQRCRSERSATIRPRAAFRRRR